MRQLRGMWPEHLHPYLAPSEQCEPLLHLDQSEPFGLAAQSQNFPCVLCVVPPAFLESSATASRTEMLWLDLLRQQPSIPLFHLPNHLHIHISPFSSYDI